MKRTALIVVACTALFSTPSFAHADKQKSLTVNQDPQLLMERFNGYAVDRRAEAIETAQKALDQLDARIAKLSQKLADRKAQRNAAAQQKAQDELNGLKQERKTLGEHFAALKEGSAETWGKVKKHFSQGFQKLHKRWQKADQEH